MNRAACEALPAGDRTGGKFKIDAEYHEKYQLLASKNGYFQNQMETPPTPIRSRTSSWSLKYDYAAEGLVLHGETEEPITGASVKLLDGEGNILEELMTADNGKYAFPLKPESDYRIVVEKEGFFKQSARISTKENRARSSTRTSSCSRSWWTRSCVWTTSTTTTTRPTSVLMRRWNWTNWCRRCWTTLR